jgi:serine/threonine-protein kinase
MRFQVGQKVGDYEFLAVVEATPTGITYRVHNLLADRHELLKVLPPDLQDDQERVDRFLREAKIHARLHHPNIAAFYNATRVDGQLVMTSELVEGTSLEQRIGSGSLPVEQAAKYFEQALSALSYAHREGVIHRDIKPAHLIITPDDSVKITGFGLAKKPADPQLTQPGIVMGSVHYMSPEQVKGSVEVDRRSDIYSLGVVLYEAVTGKKPFDSKSQFEVFLAHVNQEPERPSSVRAGIPPAIDQIILTAMAKQPAERFQTAEEFRDSLGKLRGALTTPAVKPATAAPYLETLGAVPQQEPAPRETAVLQEPILRSASQPAAMAEPSLPLHPQEIAEFSPTARAIPAERPDLALPRAPQESAEPLPEPPPDRPAQRAWEWPRAGENFAASGGGPADLADEGGMPDQTQPGEQPFPDRWEPPHALPQSAPEPASGGPSFWAAQSALPDEESGSAAGSSGVETGWREERAETPSEFSASAADAWPEPESGEARKEVPLLLRPTGDTGAHRYSPHVSPRDPEASAGSWFGEQTFAGWTSKDLLAVGALTFVIVAAVFFALLTFLNRQ